ncbi:Antibiotic biosynthesis monooxygenase [Streptomyces sp. DvalAA-14]|uniref:SchA/CurD-like domain-containing protein n=1 Tax=unclassified Streptomyces TaxID=2593676 RepID=UPI00081B4C41|nr:SchA/CurD-like domain-containing protein [Streptomyces sp. DvalAA-14]SCE49555.1 Antibiotic biosynthesis monooxygenase [Streptomyces sp. DvalAA-14]
MTTLDDRHTAPVTALPTITRLRVVLLLDVLDGKHEAFLQAYEQIRHQVAAVPGHISDQLCQSLGNSSQWLITSEWEDSESFLEWVESAAHRKMVEPLHDTVRDTTSLRFMVAAETPEGGARRARTSTASPAAGLDPLPAPPLCTGGVVRHAITFTVKAGSEPEVERILAGYRSPQAQVDDSTRLLRTSLFMHGNRVVRAVEVAGDLGNALRHVAAQPEVRAVEEAINPFLEEQRDLTDGASARAFFARAALPAIEHVAAPERSPQRASERAAGRSAQRASEVSRHAFVHPVRAAEGPAEARRLAALDAEAAADAGQPLLASTVFQRGDVLVRLVDVRAGADASAMARGGQAMAPVTDRRSDDAPVRTSPKA